MAGRRWWAAAPQIAAIGVLLLVVALFGTLFLGSAISGTLDTIAGGIPNPPAGTIRVSDAHSGYWDVPCGTDGEHCASPVPSIDPAAVSLGQPLHVPSLEIAVDHTGHYSVPAGTAVLPNGILTEATMTLRDDVHPEVTLDPSVIYLAITGDDGRRLANEYVQGWRDSAETIRVGLEFDVAALDGPTTLVVTDIVVR